MDFSLTEEQELLQETVRGFVAKGGARWLASEWTLGVGGGRLRGRKHFVPEAEGADLFVVGCRGGALALVEAGPAARAIPEPTLDRGRPLATLELDGARAEALPAGDAARLVDAGCVVLAADAFGAAQQLVRATAAY